jgi:hypothetical protein
LPDFIMSRLVEDEAEILSVAVAGRERGRGVARRMLDLHLRRLAGLGARTVFWRSTSTMTRQSGSITVPASVKCRDAPITILGPGEKPRRLWCCDAIFYDGMMDTCPTRSI